MSSRSDSWSLVTPGDIHRVLMRHARTASVEALPGRRKTFLFEPPIEFGTILFGAGDRIGLDPELLEDSLHGDHERLAMFEWLSSAAASFGPTARRPT